MSHRGAGRRGPLGVPSGTGGPGAFDGPVVGADRREAHGVVELGSSDAETPVSRGWGPALTPTPVPPFLHHGGTSQQDP
jgi:hypothetical protein